MNTILKGKKVLVTGAYGFIGSHLVNRLLKESAHVSIVVREVSNPWRVHDILGELNVYYGDVTDGDTLNQIIQTSKPDIIFHLAAYGVDNRKRDYHQAINTNIIGTANIVNAAIHAGCEKVINLGSSSEYGHYERKITEEKRLFPLDIYGSTKGAGTLLAHQLALEGELPLVTIRPFNIFGEKEEPHKLFSYIILQLLKGREVALTDGLQNRDYMYVENYIDGFILAANNQNIKNEIFNMGSGKSYPIQFYVEKLFQLIDPSMVPIFGTIPNHNQGRMHSEPNIEKIETFLNWKQRISLETGMERTISWYKQNLSFYQ